MNVFEIFAKLGLDKSEYDKKLNEAGDSGKSFGEKMSSVASAATKVTMAAVGAGATAVGAVMKQAVSAYADYEQLVGGVETLFKESSDKVVAYSNIAYKTAGMSANDYMETVTSFSASLLQGLGGDTELAADIANQAIIDMSDNANKMGTDIGMIQSAYMGFAKQNYTMLDNLKLGYGGTQEEMIRLINDSHILEDEIDNLDNVTFDQMIAAIHEIQTNLDITGTTAKEASTTIQGSLASTKSAWKNLLVGMADDTQDFDVLMAEFLDSVTTFGNNIIPRIQTTLTGVSKLIQKSVPLILQLVPGLINDALPGMLQAALDLVGGLVQAIVENAPALLEIAVNLIVDTLTDFSSAMPSVMQSGFHIVNTLLDSIRHALPQLAEVALQIIASFVENLSNGSGKIITMVLTIISEVIQVIIDNLPMLIDAVTSLIVGLAENVDQWLPLMVMMGIQLFEAIIDAIPTVVEKLAEAVPQIVYAIADILIDDAPILVNEAKMMLQTIADTLMEYAPDFMKGALGEVFAFFPEVAAEAQDVLAASWEFIQAVITKAEEVIAWFKEQIATHGDEINAVWESIQFVVENVWTMIQTFIMTTLEVIKGIMNAGTAALRGDWDGAWTAMKNTATTLFEGIKTYMTSWWNAVKTVFTTYLNIIITMWSAAWDKVKTSATEVFGKIKQAFVDWITDLKDKALTWGKDLLQNFIDGIKAKIGELVNTVKEVAGTVKDYLGFSEPEKGPLSNFHTFAPDMMDLFIQGIRENAPELGRQLDSALNGVLSDRLDWNISSEGIAPIESGYSIDSRLERLLELIEQYLPEIRNLSIVMDTGALVGQIADTVDSYLGTNLSYAMRGY